MSLRGSQKRKKSPMHLECNMPKLNTFSSSPFSAIVICHIPEPKPNIQGWNDILSSYLDPPIENTRTQVIFIYSSPRLLLLLCVQSAIAQVDSSEHICFYAWLSQSMIYTTSWGILQTWKTILVFHHFKPFLLFPLSHLMLWPHGEPQQVRKPSLNHSSSIFSTHVLYSSEECIISYPSITLCSSYRVQFKCCYLSGTFLNSSVCQSRCCIFIGL